MDCPMNLPKGSQESSPALMAMTQLETYTCHRAPWEVLAVSFSKQQQSCALAPLSNEYLPNTEYISNTRVSNDLGTFQGQNCKARILWAGRSSDPVTVLLFNASDNEAPKQITMNLLSTNLPEWNFLLCPGFELIRLRLFKILRCIIGYKQAVGFLQAINVSPAIGWPAMISWGVHEHSNNW